MAKITLVFKERIQPKVYVFDIVSINETLTQSTLMGTIILNATEKSKEDWKFVLQGTDDLDAHVNRLMDECKRLATAIIETIEDNNIGDNN